MTRSWEICLPEIYFISTLEPHGLILFVFVHWKYWYLHAFFVIVSLFYHICKIEVFWTLFEISESKEEPNIVSVGVGIIFYDKKIVIVIRVRNKGFAEISTFKVSVDGVFDECFILFGFDIQLSEQFMIIIGYWVDG